MAYELVPKLVRAALLNDKKKIESISMLLARKIKGNSPEIANEILEITASSSVGADLLRGMSLNPVPVDRESRNQLVKVEEPLVIDDPILDDDVYTQLNDFLKERELIDEFLKENIIPPNSILLSGYPGVGKTYIAKWLSFKLDLPLVSIDLATSISSYLGRSGQNIKSVFDYAKSQNVILFLDELDAIAKRRDDMGDLGELKRLVNVLLKELEECPATCIIIGATNHPEMLDKAIWRRFDRNIVVPLPNIEQRKKILTRILDKRIGEIGMQTVEFMAKNTKGIATSEICKISEHIKRQMIINKDTSRDILALKECFRVVEINNKTEKIKICKNIKNDFPNLTLRDISTITQIPFATVGRYIKENVNE